MKPLVVILSLVCVALAAQLVIRYGPEGRDGKEVLAATTRMNSFSNEVREIRMKADEEARLAAYLQSNLTARVTELAAATNNLSQTAAALAAIQSELKAKQDEAGKNAARIAELETQKDGLQLRLDELAGSIKARTFRSRRPDASSLPLRETVIRSRRSW